MFNVGRLAVAVVLAAGPVSARADEAGAAAAQGEVVRFQKTLHRGETVRLELDPSRTVEGLDVQWAKRVLGARASFDLDGVTVARRAVGDRERQSIAVRRAGSELVVRVEKADATLESVGVRYGAAIADPAAGSDADATDAPLLSTWMSETSRVVSIRRKLKSGDRVAIPAAYSGMKIREVRIHASATDFRGRLRLEGIGSDPAVQTIAQKATAIFPTPASPDDTEDLTLVMDLRGAVVEDVLILYDPPAEVVSPAR